MLRSYRVGEACGFCFTGTENMYLTTSQHDIQICEFWTFFCPWTLEVCSSIAVTDRDFFQQAGQAASGCISWDVREVGI